MVGITKKSGLDDKKALESEATKPLFNGSSLFEAN